RSAAAKPRLAVRRMVAWRSTRCWPRASSTWLSRRSSCTALAWEQVIAEPLNRKPKYVPRRRTHRPSEGRRAVAKLIYTAIMSLDGYIEDERGKFDWAAPDEEVHAFVNDLERAVGTYLYGRRMYETMVFWESPPDLADQPPFVQDFAEIW